MTIAENNNSHPFMEVEPEYIIAIDAYKVDIDWLFSTYKEHNFALLCLMNYKKVIQITSKDQDAVITPIHRAWFLNRTKHENDFIVIFNTVEQLILFKLKFNL